MARKYRNITDNVHGLVRLTSLESRVAEHPVFNRLHYVYQNSSAYLTWPSMRNRRFEHSLGTMKLAGDMFFEAVQNTDVGTLVSFYEYYAGEILQLERRANRHEHDVWVKHGKIVVDSIRVMLHDPSIATSSIDCDGIRARLFDSAGYCSFLVPSVVPEKYRLVHNVLAQSIRLVGMLHDLGHPPFSHVCESALKSLYSFAGKLEGRAAADYVKALDAYCRGERLSEVDLHEVIGNDLVSLTIEDACKDVKEADDELLSAIYFAVSLTAQAIISDKDGFQDLHALVSGTVDADRLDYVQRDSISAGFGTDALQYARLIDGMRIVFQPNRVVHSDAGDSDTGGKNDAEEDIENEERHSFAFAMPMKTLPTVEAFLRKRLENYRTIIFHHRVVKSGAFLRDVVIDLALEELGNGKAVPNSLRLPDNVSGLWMPLLLNHSGTDDSIKAFSQWNDSWLINMLSGEYLECASAGVQAEIPRYADTMFLRKAKLGELLYSVKSYQSLVKRSSDCAVFRKHLEMLLEADAKLQERVDEYTSSFAKANAISNGANKVIENIFDLVNGLSNYCQAMRQMHGLFRRIPYNGIVYDDYNEMFSQMLTDSFDSLNVDYVDFFVERNTIKAGISDKEGAYFYYEDDPSVSVSLTDVSEIKSELQMEVDEMPAMFLFLLPADGQMVQRPTIEKLMRSMAEKHYERIVAMVNSLDEVIVK